MHLTTSIRVSRPDGRVTTVTERVVDLRLPSGGVAKTIEKVVEVRWPDGRVTTITERGGRA